MITGWVKNLISAILPGEANTIGQGAQAYEKKARANLIDVTEGASLSEEARRQSLELLSMVQKGGAKFDRLRFWINVRRKMRKSIADFYDMSEITEEVTEKILEAAEHDPFYKRMFR